MASLSWFTKTLLVHVISVQSALLCGVLLSTVGFFLGITVGPVHAVLSALAFVLTALGTFRYLGHPNWKLAAAKYVATTVLIAGCASGLLDGFLDISSDSQTAHGPAVIHLANGWNPVYDPFFGAAPSKVPQNYPLLTAVRPEWLDYAAAAAKLPYVIRASVYSVTSHIDSVHFINVLIASLVLAFAFVTLRVLDYSPAAAAATAGVAFLSPIFMSQLTTLYIDQWIGAFLSLLAFGAFWISREDATPIKIVCGQALLLLLSTKLTGFVLGGLFFLFYNALAWHSRRGLWLASKQLLWLTLAGLPLLAHPFGTNVIHFKNAFHPVSGGDKAIIAGSMEGFYSRANRWDGLVTSLFSESLRGGSPPTKKKPWEIYRREQVAFQGPDARIAGLGPYFGLALLLGLATFLVSLLFRSAHQPISFLLAVLCFGLALIWPVTYWFRFSPQLWLVPLFLVLAGWGPKGARLPVRVLGTLTLLTCLVSTVFVGQAAIRTQLELTRVFRLQMEYLRAQDREYEVFFSNFHLGRARLRQAGVRFRPVKLCTRGPAMVLVYSENQVCRDPFPLLPLTPPELLTANPSARLPGG